MWPLPGSSSALPTDPFDALLICDSWETRAFRGRGRGRTTWSPAGSERSVAVEAMVAAGSAGSGSVRPLPQAPRVCLCLLAWVDADESISTAFLVRVLWFAGGCGRRKTVVNTSECDRGRRDRRDGEGGIQSGSNRRHCSQRPTKSHQISQAEAIRRRRIERSGHRPCFLAGTNSSAAVHRI